MHKTTLLITAAIFSFLTHRNSSAVENNAQLSASAAMVHNEEKSEVLTRANFEEHVKTLYDEIDLSSYNLPYNVFQLAMVGYYSLEKEGALGDKQVLTVIDFSKASTEKRFYTIDLKNRKVKFNTYVAHGRNTGQNLATEFSNTPHSNQSSLGFYVTGETYTGSKGYSLRLDGKEKSVNDNIRRRAVVIHAADYATEGWIRRYGRLGRSQGCPALPPHLSKDIINTIKDKTTIFTYYPDRAYLTASRYLRIDDLLQKLNEAPIILAGFPTGESL